MKGNHLKLKTFFVTYWFYINNVYTGRLSNWLIDKSNTAIACQGDSENIMCDAYQGIRIKDAFWGRDNKVDCQVDNPLSPLTDTQMCFTLDKDYAYRKLAEVCQGQQTCQFEGTSLYFDTELCPHIRKYARVKYECRQMSGMKKSDLLRAVKHKPFKGSKRTILKLKNHKRKKTLHDSFKNITHSLNKTLL
ncbi:protein eva-1 homolog C-like [Hydra vulgaris]|uniref:Protein eva-1 homolog C-like n=1 Tax=Hydra vulgaris TaxID=6087 RepID=A0ABM4BPY3_HYDVU